MSNTAQLTTKDLYQFGARDAVEVYFESIFPQMPRDLDMPDQWNGISALSDRGFLYYLPYFKKFLLQTPIGHGMDGDVLWRRCEALSAQAKEENKPLLDEVSDILAILDERYLADDAVGITLEDVSSSDPSCFFVLLAPDDARTRQLLACYPAWPPLPTLDKNFSALCFSTRKGFLFFLPCIMDSLKENPVGRERLMNLLERSLDTLDEVTVRNFQRPIDEAHALLAELDKNPSVNRSFRRFFRPG